MVDHTQINGEDLQQRVNTLKMLNPIQELANEDVVSEEDHIRFGYRLGEYNLLLQEGMDSEVIKNPTVFPVPKSPGWLSGLINLRGNIVSVIDLERILAGHAGSHPDRMSDFNILVLGKGENAVGIKIEGIPQSVRIESGRENPQLPQLLEPYVNGAYPIDGNLWLEFDHVAFLEQWVTHTDKSNNA